MQYLIKLMMVSIANAIIGGFLGMIMSIGYVMMNGSEQQILGCALFYGMAVIPFVYCFLLKKFVMGAELSITIPGVCMLIGMFIGYNCNVYV